MTHTAEPIVMDLQREPKMHPATQAKGEALVSALSGQRTSIDSATKYLSTLPVPHRRVERWKHTAVSGFWAEYSEPVVQTIEAAGCEACPVPGLHAYRIVFVNGNFDAEASDLPVHSGVCCEPLSMSGAGLKTEGNLESSEWFAALNGAFAVEGMKLQVERGVILDRPLLVHHHTSGPNSANIMRHEIEVEENAQVQLIHWSTANEAASGMVNIMTHIQVASGAIVALDKVQDEAGAVHHLAFEQINQARSSQVRIHTGTIQGKWVRNDLNFRLNGEGCDAVLNGFFLPKGNEFVDNHTTVDHRAAHCTSSEQYQGILYGSSTGVFNGKVFVRPDAQQTNAYQQNGNILVTDKATINAKPELEIYADDVKCSHGCTIGQFDEEALFYARSRGIGETEAKAMLVHAFVGDVLEGFAVQEVRLEVEHRLATKHSWDTWNDTLESA
jgi:Fe-S cluster assembly protein SufD